MAERQPRDPTMLYAQHPCADIVNPLTAQQIYALHQKLEEPLTAGEAYLAVTGQPLAAQYVQFLAEGVSERYMGIFGGRES